MYHFSRAYILLLFLMIYGCSNPPGPLLHRPACEVGAYSIKGAECLDEEVLVDKLEPYPVIFIGDHHDNNTSLDFTRSLIMRMQQRAYRIHLANEWFVPEDQPLLDRYLAQGDDGNFTQAIAWEEKAGYDFERYRPIYEAVREGGGSLHGINLAKTFRQKLSDQDLVGMDEVERAFFDALDLNTSVHKQLLSPFFEHCHSPKEGESELACSQRMYRVQVAWDTMMAQESARLATEVLKTPKDRLLVFVGAMHLYDGLGVNMRFARRSDLPFVTLLPAISMQEGYEHAQADYLFLYKVPGLAEDENK
jgi:uncharacterized iron-regulated protein